MFKLTVVICVFNEEITIIEALRSLYENETYNDTEIIIVDDFSENEVTKTLLIRLEKFTRVKLIRSQENMGLSYSRNLGFEHATTNYIFPLDADDTLPPNTLDVVYNTFLSNPNIDFIAGDYSIIDLEKSETQLIDCNSLSTNGLVDVVKLSKHWALLGTSPCKKSAWAKVGGYNLKYSYTVQDVDFWIRIMQSGCIGKYINKSIYTWNKSAQGMNAKFDRFEMVKLLEDHPNFYLLSQSKKQLYNTIFESHYPYKQLKTLLKLGKKYFFWLKPINKLRFTSIIGKSLFNKP